MKFNIDYDKVLGRIYYNGIIRIRRARKGKGFIGYLVIKGVAESERRFPTLKAAKEYYSN